jgi:hypothetical protein
MSSLSLNASVRTCKVDSGQATRIQSDRFQNPGNMVCIPWNGINNKGQVVSPDSFYTKMAGCNSATDRVSVENALRPQYSDYINQNMAGIQGDIYGGNTNSQQDTRIATDFSDSRNKITGNFGNQWQSSNYSTCGLNAYENGMASLSQANRQASYSNQAYLSNQSRQGGSCS